MTQPTTKDNQKRLLVCMLSYNSASFILDTLFRIPKGLDRFGAEVLVIDDASTDETTQKISDANLSNFSLPLVVLRNATNQGYGGNAKLGITYAIQKEFDAIAFTHADGQYPPELILDFAPLVLNDGYSAISGSRMHNRRDALRGKMPLYKFFGNIFLTNFQNFLLSSNFSEFHTGFRIYDTKSLNKIPYDLASNYFDFDTDITLQFMEANLKIDERPIPTKYGNETSRVNVFKYGIVILRSTIAFWLQKRGLIYVRKFDISQKNGEEERSSNPSTLTEAHKLAIEKLKENSTVALIGCGGGFLCDRISAAGCKPTVIDYDSSRDQSDVRNFARPSASTLVNKNIGKFDYTLLLDSLCQTPDPERLVSLIHAADCTKNALIATVPNVGFILSRVSFLFGNFNYATKGVLRHEHLKLYTRASIIALFEHNNFKIESIQMTVAPFGNVFRNTFLVKALTFINLGLIKIAPNLFGYSMIISVTPRSDLKKLLSQATLTWPKTYQRSK